MCFYLFLLVVSTIAFLPLKPTEANCLNGQNYRSVLLDFAKSVRIVCRSMETLSLYLNDRIEKSCCAFDLAACGNAKRSYDYYHPKKNRNIYFQCYFAFYSLHFDVCNCSRKLNQGFPTRPLATPPTTPPTTHSINGQYCGLSGWNPSRIIGGTISDQCEFPWMAHLHISEHQCGGALVDDEHILTAYHCIENQRKNQIAIFLGPRKFQVKKMIGHPQYRINDDGVYNDIAIIKLSKKVKFTNCRRPICLPDTIHRITNDSNCVAAGWGRTETSPPSDQLLKAIIPIWGTYACKRHIPGYEPSMLCAGNMLRVTDSCTGDSGGPLMCPENGKWVLAGLVSFGDGNCDGMGIYANVTHLVDWVLNNLN